MTKYQTLDNDGTPIDDELHDSATEAIIHGLEKGLFRSNFETIYVPEKRYVVKQFAKEDMGTDWKHNEFQVLDATRDKKHCVSVFYHSSGGHLGYSDRAEAVKLAEDIAEWMEGRS